jgi:hypothetical protein
MRGHVLAQQDRTKSARGDNQRGNMLVSIVRSGGFAGIHETFAIYPDGKATNPEGKMQQIQAKSLDSILRQIGALDLPRSCQIVFPPSSCSDCFQYRITLTGSNGTRTLILDETQIGGWDSVSKLAREIRDLIAELKWK